MRSILALLIALSSALAHAFCGFYVGGADAKLYNSATNVVMMRGGTTTALSIQNDYTGPPKDFAMVVPVPVVLKKSQVKTLDRAVFERVDRLAAPRLVEYWEQDPCWQPDVLDNGAFFGAAGLGMRGTGSGGGGAGFGVKVEARFAVGEYTIIILSATEAAGLEAWLRAKKYRIPDKASALLAPYIRQGMKFVVAKVNPKKVRFEEGRAVLSPLRMVYEDKQLRLPVRLGLINSGGVQDLLVHILAPNQRYEAANFENVTIPTNLDVAPTVRGRFGEFYAALFDATVAKHPGAVVTEYAWQATKCDPCPGPVLSVADLTTLGVDQLGQDLTTPYTAVKLDRPRVRGAMDRSIIERVLRRHQRRFQFCADRLAARRALPADTLDMSYIIDPVGRVKMARIKGFNHPLRTCLEGAFRRIRFPPGKGGGMIVVDQSIKLRSKQRRVRPGALNTMVLTRLHYRYTPGDLGEDLVFAPAKPIVGGREFYPGGVLETGAETSSFNNFQGRYAIRNRWEGPVTCENPVRGRWGGPPNGGAETVQPAVDLTRGRSQGADLGRGR